MAHDVSLRTVRLVLVNPAWRAFALPAGTLVTTSPGADGAELDVASLEDAVTIRVEGAAGQIRRVELFRSITSSDQLYYIQRGHELLVSDHFAALLKEVPPNDTVPPAAVLDHLLFRTTPGEGTYTGHIRRVGNGSRVSWDASGAAPPVTEIVQRLGRREPPMATNDAVRNLDLGLTESVAGLGSNVRNLLSGGVDSTLIQSFLPANGSSVSATIDAPEFALEESYARAAASLLGSNHRFVRLREADYEQHLRDVIRRCGLPPHHLQTVLVDAAVEEPGDYVSGQFADALFGLDASLRVWRIRRYHLPAVRLLIERGAWVRWPRARNFADRIKEDLARLACPVTDPRGFGMQFAVYSDVAAIREWFGDDAVDDRLAHRLRYVRDRMEPYDSADDPIIQHLELGHWIDFFCDDTVTIWRQCAHARGSSLAAPFTRRAIVELAMSVPAKERFCDSRGTKPLLKRLLAARVPAYPARQPKGGSGLPLDRYLREGPLRNLAEEALRAEWPLPLRDAKTTPSGWLIWNQITLRLWNEITRSAEVWSPPAGLRMEFSRGSEKSE